MLYLINCEVVENYYMGKSIRIETNHIVESESEEEARDKVERYYELKDSIYYITHHVSINYCNEVIK